MYISSDSDNGLEITPTASNKVYQEQVCGATLHAYSSKAMH